MMKMGGIALKKRLSWISVCLLVLVSAAGMLFSTSLPKRKHLLTRHTQKHRLSTRLTGLRIIFRHIISYLIITLQNQKHKPSAGWHQKGTLQTSLRGKASAETSSQTGKANSRAKADEHGVKRILTIHQASEIQTGFFTQATG